MSWYVAASIVGGSSIVSGYMGSQAAKKAAQQQADAMRYAANISQRQYEQTRADLGPYREQGYATLKDIRERMPYLTGQFEDYKSQYLDPSMAFRLGMGTQETQRLANVGGGALSGNTLRALQDYAQNFASTEYGNAFNRFQTERANIYNTLGNIAGMGMGAVNTGVQAGTANAQNLAQLAAGVGQAQAAGTMGGAQAWNNALGNVSNLASTYAIMKSLPSKTPAVA